MKDSLNLLKALELTDRQSRELEYHRLHAQKHAHEHRTVSFDCLDPQKRRWWNAYWEMFRYLRSLELRGKKCLVVGCGFGEDALLLSKLGAEVYAFDLSAQQLAIARRLSTEYALPVHFEQMTAEHMTYPASFFDLVLIVDILHHCELSQALTEIRRVAKPGAVVVIDEIYTHSFLQGIRESRWVAERVYPGCARRIYGTSRYITEDERKLNERDLDEIIDSFQIRRLDFYCAVVKRFIPERAPWISKLDRALLCTSQRMGRLLAGRFVLIAAAESSKTKTFPCAESAESSISIEPVR